MAKEGENERIAEGLEAVRRLVNKATDDYARQRELATVQAHEAAKNFDQTLVTLSAGAVALSVSYLRPAAPSMLLVGAWSAFALALVAALVSFKYIQVPLRLEAERWSEAIKRSEAGLGEAEIGTLRDAEAAFQPSRRETGLLAKIERSRTIVTTIHLVALLSIVCGVVLLLAASARVTVSP
jgi:hypothetical protein